MATIKNGFDDKALHIRLSSRGVNESIEITIEQEGLNTGAERTIQRYETLSYASLSEIITLRDELNKVIAEAVGLK